MHSEYKCLFDDGVDIWLMPTGRGYKTTYDLQTLNIVFYFLPLHKFTDFYENHIPINLENFVIKYIAVSEKLQLVCVVVF